MTEYDAFISYQWNVKPTVECLYNYLKKKKNLKIWIDLHEMGSTNLNDEIAKGIENSKVIVCCITQAYSQSKNCIREINYASTLKKPMVILMLERLEIGDLGGLGLIINPLVRINCYKFSEHWKKENFETVYESVVSNLNINNPAKDKELEDKPADEKSKGKKGKKKNRSISPHGSGSDRSKSPRSRKHSLHRKRSKSPHRK